MDELILAEQTFTSILSADFGIYLMDVPAEMELKIGETYKVVFDNQEFTCTCQDCSVLMAGATAVGNGAAFGLAGNNEPFIVVSYPDGNEYTVGCLLDTGPTTHTIAIYHVAAAEVGIIQYDRSGNRMEFYGKDTLRVDTTDGGTMDFVHADLVEKNVELDFSGGDMNIEPGVGEMFAAVSIPKPVTLIPENVAEGVNIAGIIGNLVAGGGGNYVYASGTFKDPAADNNIIHHNLGVVPDIIVVYTGGFSTISTESILQFFMGFSKAFSQAIDETLISIQLQTRYATTSGGYKVYRQSWSRSDKTAPYKHYIDAAYKNVLQYVFGANEETFEINNVSGSMGYVDSTLSYNWFAIGGLT